VPRLTGRALGIGLVILLAVTGAVVGMGRLNRAVNPSPRSAAAAAADPVVPKVGTTGASTCTDRAGGNEWRITWKVTGAPPAGSSSVAARAGATVIVPTGFAVRRLQKLDDAATSSPAATRSLGATAPAGATPGSSPSAPGPVGWLPKDTDLWLLRWSPTLAETMKARPDETFERVGPLATLQAIPVDVGQSPRYVSPDGACTVFLVPYVAGSARERTVAVLGDSLVSQLYASLDGSVTEPGVLEHDLEGLGLRPEINGQAGRRFTRDPDKPLNPETADVTMMDEIRGLSDADARVIALGTNDAGFATLSPDPTGYETRMAYVLFQLGAILDEVQAQGRCTVLVTMSTRNKIYLTSAPGRFDDASRRINAYLTERAHRSPGRVLRVYDWAAVADQHIYGTPEAWFGNDTIHLTANGRRAYADALTKAAALC
jgi:lysophospholipase L1-like esterase